MLSHLCPSLIAIPPSSRYRYYAEKVRQQTYDLDESEIKPYFPLDRMCEAIFDCAYQLFGLKFQLRPDIASYHPDVQTYEVRERGIIIWWWWACGNCLRAVYTLR